MVERWRGLNTPIGYKGVAQTMVLFYKGHMDPDYGGKVKGLKYLLFYEIHMDPDYGGKVEGLKYSYSLNFGHMDPDMWQTSSLDISKIGARRKS